jgi:HK97 gp10 family phage protein
VARQRVGVYQKQVFRFDVDFSDVEDALKELPRAVGRSAVLAALKEGAKPIAQQMRENAPQGPTGNLKKSIVVSTMRIGRRIKSRRSVFVFVGADTKLGPHAHLIERGTAPRTPKDKKVMKGKDGTFYGTKAAPMKPQPFLRPAWEATKWKAIDIIKKQLWVKILQRTKTMRRKAEAGTLGKAAVRSLRS